MDTHTHKPTTVTLAAHARRWLINYNADFHRLSSHSGVAQANILDDVSISLLKSQIVIFSAHLATFIVKI